MTGLLATTIFSGALLLFLVQPLVGKLILPWFGGAAAVWTTCLLFFQVTLLLGYLYAYWTARLLRPRAQMALHVALIAASLAVLPIVPDASWAPPGAGDPTVRVVAVLAASVGIPYLLLSATGPLLQAWYVSATGSAAPYRLFALSNAGSMIGLLSYPILVEPLLAARAQAGAWSVAYGAFAVSCVAVTASTWRRVGDAAERGVPEERATLAGGTLALWIALPACGSALLLAVTNQATYNVAPVPFLWVVMLALYLATFIACFAADHAYRRVPFRLLLGVAAPTMGVLSLVPLPSLRLQLLVYAGGLFVVCMALHGELARLRPPAVHLTAYYLCIALGGALGAVSVSLVAPWLFRTYLEFVLTLAASTLLVGAIAARASTRSRKWLYPLPTGLLIGVATVHAALGSHDVRVKLRNFYGTLRVTESGKNEQERMRQLYHGTIVHGQEYVAASLRHRATSYYGPTSGIGLTMLNFRTGNPRRIGVIGLGAGTLATYGRPGDTFRFYELNPQVVMVAEREFWFLRDSTARTEIVTGDARLSLAREEPQAYDVLVLDAFSSDSIPVHLLTREAFVLYWRHLRPDGVLAVHVSNQYLNLQPVVVAAASALGKHAVAIGDRGDSAQGTFRSDWVLVTSNEEFLALPAIGAAANAPVSVDGLRTWTDDYSNLVSVLR